MSSILRTAVSGPEPVSLSDMKNILKLAPAVTADDAYITAIIKAARQTAELITEAVLVRSTFVQYLDHFPSWRSRVYGYGALQQGSVYAERHPGEIRLRRGPVVSVQSLTYIGTDGNPAVLSPGVDFTVDVASQPARIRPALDTSWPAPLCGVLNAIAIRFTAGYSPNAEGVADGQTGISEPETLVEGALPTPPNQQAAYTIDWTLPETISLAISQLVAHWYFNREPVVASGVAQVPMHVEQLLATVQVVDFDQESS